MAMMVISSLVNRTKRRVIATVHSPERCTTFDEVTCKKIKIL